MGKSIVRLALIIHVLLFSMGVQALDMSQEDKQKHMALSGAISAPTYLTMRAKKYSRLQSVATALALSMLVGHAKETRDKKYDGNDMQANAIGALSGVALSLSFEF